MKKIKIIVIFSLVFVTINYSPILYSYLKGGTESNPVVYNYDLSDISLLDTVLAKQNEMLIIGEKWTNLTSNRRNYINYYIYDKKQMYYYSMYVYIEKKNASFKFNQFIFNVITRRPYSGNYKVINKDLTLSERYIVKKRIEVLIIKKLEDAGIKTKSRY